MEGKCSSQSERFLHDVCQLRSRLTIFTHVSEHGIFFTFVHPIGGSIIAVECDWNSMISQNERNFVFFL